MTTVLTLLEASGVECYTRSEWGSPRQADGSYARRRSTHPMPAGPARYHFLHITVTADTDTVLEGAAGARQVESYGLSTPPMVSYQDLVTNEGKYYEGQSYGVKGTHTVNDKNVPGFANDLNLLGYACAIMQNVDDEVTDVQVDVIARVFAARELLGLVRRGAPIYPHRMFDWKECPGDKAVARLSEISRLRDRYVAAGALPNMEDDMPLSDADIKKVANAAAEQAANRILNHRVEVTRNGETKKIRVEQLIRQAANSPAVIRNVFDKLTDDLEEVVEAIDTSTGPAGPSSTT